MVKAKVKAAQEEPLLKKKANKTDAKEVHVAKVEHTVATKKRKPLTTESTEPAEQLETTIKGKKNKKVQSAEVILTNESDNAAEPVEVGKSETKKKQSVSKTEKQTKLRQQVLNVDKNGLSIMPVRVRRMLLDVVFNQKNRIAEKELSTHKETLLEASNLKEGYLSYHGFSQNTSTYLRGLVNSHVDAERVKYERKKVKALVEASPHDANNKPVLSEQLQNLIDETRQLVKSNSGPASLTAVYQQYDKKFYKEFTELQRIYNLTGEDAYKFYKSLVSRDKIRLNLSGNLKLTAFIELVLKQVVAQANVSCVLNGKTTLNLGNMRGAFVGNNYLFPVIEALSAWTSAAKYGEQTGAKQKKSELTEEDTTIPKTLPSFIDVEQLNPNNKFKYNSYIVDLCKNVSRSLLTNPPQDDATSDNSQSHVGDAFGSVKISSEFRSLCNQLLLEFLHNVGNILKVIISTGKDRTVTSSTVDALIHTYHLAFNLTDKLGLTYTELNGMIAAYNNAQLALRANKTNGTKNESSI